MFTYMHKAISAVLFAAFASQASAMFIQPDTYEVTAPGVGTNRYAYGSDDPVNKIDRNGHDSFGVGTADQYGQYPTDSNGNSKYVGGFTYNSTAGYTAYSPTSDTRGFGPGAFISKSTIELGFSEVASNPFTGTKNYHSFVRIEDDTDATGVTLNVFRGGPERQAASPSSAVGTNESGTNPGGFGNIAAVSGAPAMSIEYGGAGPTAHQTALTTNMPYSEVTDKMEAFEKAVNSAKISYAPLTQNSNSYANGLVETLGFGSISPIYNTPGYYNVLSIK